MWPVWFLMCLHLNQPIYWYRLFDYVMCYLMSIVKLFETISQSPRHQFIWIFWHNYLIIFICCIYIYICIYTIIFINSLFLFSYSVKPQPPFSDHNHIPSMSHTASESDAQYWIVALPKQHSIFSTQTTLSISMCICINHHQTTHEQIHKPPLNVFNVADCYISFPTVYRKYTLTVKWLFSFLFV